MRFHIAFETREMKVRPAAYARHVRYDLASLHSRSDVKSRTQPYMPVLRDHHAGGHAMADQHATMKRRVDHVTDDHAVARSSDRLDATRDVDAGVQPHRARGAGSQRRAVAVAPLTAETQAVRRPRGQGKLKNIRRVGDRRGWRRRRRDEELRERKEDPRDTGHHLNLRPARAGRSADIDDDVL